MPHTPQPSQPTSASAPEAAPRESEPFVVTEVSAFLPDGQQSLASSYDKMPDRPPPPVATGPVASQPEIEETIAGWRRESEADSALMAQMPAMRTYVQEHASPELLRLLENTGLGNHREVLKFVASAMRGGRR